MADVVVMLGSASDIEKMEPCLETMKELKMDFFATICSAHRTPERVEKIIRDHANARVFICAAGMAAHLAGAVAARTPRPVIGVPLASGSLAGMDALFSTVQMPPGFPVATVALGGAKNAALLAAAILALNDRKLYGRLERMRHKMAEAVEASAADFETKNDLT